MKRPEQTNYPTDQKQFDNSKQIIEDGINRDVFTFKESSGIVITPNLQLWLNGFGWEITHIPGDFREPLDEGYLKLTPYNPKIIQAYLDR
tara:strand:+ start:182 stop:451 length:270 start_codon:yes stop_codon:yes gene_type:complete